LNNKKQKEFFTVAQVLPALKSGGVERGTIQIANALVKKGHRSIVISNGGPLTAEIIKGGSEHIKLNVGKKNFSVFILIYNLAKIFREYKIDIIHARSRLPAWICKCALALLPESKKPFWITTVHGPYTPNRYSKIMTSGDRVIAISEFIKDYILSNYKDIDQKKIVLIPRGADKTRYFINFQPSCSWVDNWKLELGNKASLPLLTMPARLTRWKGQIEFIKMITLLKKRNINFHGLIVGGHDKDRQRYLEELKSKIFENNIESHITLLGDRKDLREILSVSALAFSLTTIPEAFGRTTIESLMLGTPVIGYDHGGTREILKSCFPEGSVEVGNVDQAALLAEKFLISRPAIKPTDLYTTQNMEIKTIKLYENLFD